MKWFKGIKWVLAWDYDRVPSILCHGPKRIYATLYYIFMWTGILSIDDYEIKIWSTLKNIEDIPYPAETNI